MTEFDKKALLDAFDAIGTAAIENHTKLELAIYGGSAMMLASNFRFATEDVYITQPKLPSRGHCGFGKLLPAWPLRMAGTMTGSTTPFSFISAL